MFNPSCRRLTFLSLLAILALMATGATSAQRSPSSDGAQVASRASDHAFRSSPVMFVENAGQWDERARFQVWGGTAGTMWLAEDAIWLTVVEQTPVAVSRDDRLRNRDSATFDLKPSDMPPARVVNLKLSFVGANPHPRIEPFDRLDTVVSYFIGNDPDQWRPDVPVWGEARYVDLYPGVDLEITSEAGQIVQRLVAQPGADLNAVRLRVEGADSIAVDDAVLRLSTAAGDVAWPLLRADRMEIVAAQAQPLGAQAFDVATPFAFTDANSQSIIRSPQSVVDNPTHLLYGTFLGGGGSYGDDGTDVAVDGSGTAYVTGIARSSDFPTTPGAFDTTNSFNTAFVVKLNAAGSTLDYATFIGGSSGDYGKGIAVDGSGAAYVTGYTGSSDFPATPGAFDTNMNGLSDVFVVRLNADGSALVYATFLGGSSDYDWGYDIAVDGSGAAYVIGDTKSSDFPTTPGAFDRTHNGGYYDVFVAKLNPAGSALAYATFLGGGSSDWSAGIVVDGGGAAYVTGWTSSTNFPTTSGAFDTTHNGGYFDAFVAKMNPAGTAMVYATFLGGSSDDVSYDVAVDGSGTVYVTGSTDSPNFPTTPSAFDTTHNGSSDSFVAKLDRLGSGLVYATFLGGSDGDRGYGIAVDGSGAACITGSTESTDFRPTPDAFDITHNGGNFDTFVAKLNATASALTYATFLGGGSDDVALSITVDRSGAAYVTGWTSSTDFPTTSGAFDTSMNGSGDAFVVKLAMGMTPSYTISGRVTDASGHGILGVMVSAGFPRLTSTGTDGYYSLTGLSAGSYDVYAYLSPYSFTPASVPVTVPGNAVSINFTAAPATITEIEINQALGKQLYDETRYVAGKNTAIRVWLSVPVRVDEEQQLTVRQTNPPYASTVLRPAERDGERSAIITFLCPAASCAGGLQGAYALEASVNGATSVRSVDFLARKTIRVLAVPVKAKDGNQVKHLHPIQWTDSWRFLAQVYPVAEDGIDWTLYPEELDGTSYDLTDQGRYEPHPIWGNFRWTGQIGLLDALQGLQSPECSADPSSSPDCYDKIIGFIPTVSTCNNSCSCPLGWAASSKWRVPAVVMVDGEMQTACTPSGQFSIASMRSSIAHEVGHTYGLGEEYDIPGTGYACDVNPPPPTYPTGSPSGHCTLSTEEPWPYGNGSGSLVSVTKARPFELVSTMQNVAERGELTDKVGFMGNPSYQRDAWVTPRSYRYLFIKIGAPVVATASADAASERVAWLSGAIAQDGEVRLAPGYSFTGMPPVLDSGRYSLDVLDASNTTLATQQFDVSFTDLSNPPQPLIQAPLNVLVRLPTGAASIQVRDGVAVLLTTPISPHAPTVAVTSPTAGSILSGTQTVAWEASDTDMDQLHYTIEYIQPSRTHLTLASNITATQLQVNFDYLPGGSVGEIRVWATDGINSAKAIVGGLVVASKQPQIFISTPIDGGTYPLGSSVALSGSAYDPQDGWLRSSAALAWYLDQDALLGHGGTVYVKTLAEGPHTITLHATNSAGMTVVGSVRIFVGAKLYLPLISRGM